MAKIRDMRGQMPGREKCMSTGKVRAAFVRPSLSVFMKSFKKELGRVSDMTLVATMKSFISFE